MPGAAPAGERYPRRCLDWVEEGGRVVLLRPKLGRTALGRWLAGLTGDPHYRIRLDETGSLVWRACDGATPCTAIVAALQRHLGPSAESVDARVQQFLSRLVRGRMLVLADRPAAGEDR